MLERHDGEDQDDDKDSNDGGRSEDVDDKRRPSSAVVNHVKESHDHEIVRARWLVLGDNLLMDCACLQQMACHTLQTLFKLMILVGATIAVFGQGYSQLLLHLYGGNNPTMYPSQQYS